MTPKGVDIVVRKAVESDATTILALVDALAEFERLTPPDAAAKRRLIKDMTGEKPRFDAFIAEVNGKPAGYAFILETYSSFLALPTLYLEDLFVLPEFRKIRVGYTLFKAIVAEAHNRGCGRMEWTVLDWNRIALDFYERVGATHMGQWQLYRLTKQDLERLVTRV